VVLNRRQGVEKCNDSVEWKKGPEQGGHGREKDFTAIGAKKNPYPINRIILGKSKSIALSPPLPNPNSEALASHLGELPPKCGDDPFSSNSISIVGAIVFTGAISRNLAAIFPLKRIVSTVCARVSLIDARSEDTTHNVRMGRAP
jgi:hypothetical protein